MKIGDNVYVHGYIDEIRNDTVIIRNNGGYFGTVPSEIISGELPQRMRGRWIEDGYNDEKAVCDQCGEPCATYIMGKPRDKYCKWCGADMIENAPTVEPQRMRGKGRWNAYYHGEENGKSIFSYSCNQCGYGAPYNFIGGVCEQKKWNFCPNCGADMRETE